MFTKKAKKTISIAALACFLSTPISYTINTSSAAASAFDNQTKIEQRHDASQKERNDNDKRHDFSINDKKEHSDNDKKPTIARGDEKKSPNDKDNKPFPPRKENNTNDKITPPPPKSDNNRNDKNDKNPPPPPRNDDKDKNPPPPPPKDRQDKDNSDKDYDKSDITTAVLVGGVIGAVIAKNT